MTIPHPPRPKGALGGVAGDITPQGREADFANRSGAGLPLTLFYQIIRVQITNTAEHRA